MSIVSLPRAFFPQLPGRCSPWRGTLRMTPITGDEIQALVQPGRVNRRLYTDPDIFELELERIFGSAWIYVGHESQVRNPGDFLSTRIGRRPLLLVRDAD